MSSNFLGKAALGVAAAATLLIAAPGIASADVGPYPDHDGGSTSAHKDKSHVPDIKVICVIKGDHEKKWDKKKDGSEPYGSTGKQSGSDPSRSLDENHRKPGSVAATNTQTQIILVNVCGDKNGTATTAAQAAAIAGAAAAGNADLSHGLRAGRVPVGAVAGGDGGAATPNAGFAAGGAGALMVAALGTVLMRRRTSEETGA